MRLLRRRTIYLSVLCDAGSCGQYCKSVKIAPLGSYLSEHLTAPIEQTYKELIGECNPNHVVASAMDRHFHRRFLYRTPSSPSVQLRGCLGPVESSVKQIYHQVRQRRRQTWLDLLAHRIDESGHGQEQRRDSEDKRAKEKILLDRIGAEKRTLISSRHLLMRIKCWANATPSRSGRRRHRPF